MNPITKIREERRKDFQRIIESFYKISIDNMNVYKNDIDIDWDLIKSFLFQTENLILEEIEKWAEKEKKESTGRLRLDEMSRKYNEALSDLLTFLEKNK